MKSESGSSLQHFWPGVLDADEKLSFGQCAGHDSLNELAQLGCPLVALLECKGTQSSLVQTPGETATLSVPICDVSLQGFLVTYLFECLHTPGRM